jgi:hypothetical protein
VIHDLSNEPIAGTCAGRRTDPAAPPRDASADAELATRRSPVALQGCASAPNTFYDLQVASQLKDVFASIRLSIRRGIVKMSLRAPQG